MLRTPTNSHLPPELLLEVLSRTPYDADLVTRLLAVNKVFCLLIPVYAFLTTHSWGLALQSPSPITLS